jgi:hypothetical protein
VVTVRLRFTFLVCAVFLILLFSNMHGSFLQPVSCPLSEHEETGLLELELELELELSTWGISGPSWTVLRQGTCSPLLALLLGLVVSA